MDEIREKVIELLRLPDEIVDEPHKGNASQQTELDYQLAWARTRLKNYGAIANSKRGVWMITPEFADKSSISRSEITEHIKKTRLAGKSKTEVEKILADGDPTNDSDAVPEELEPWRRSLAEVLHSMNPYAFETVSDVAVARVWILSGSRNKKIGDGGIDGTGKLRINGIF